MSDIVIRAQDLGKRYALGKSRSGAFRYGSLRDSLSQAARQLFTRDDNEADPARILWALRHIDFEIKRGEVVGIIGRNGAGKSTLLKILSRITEPTEGRVELRGRVGSLLEVGTGFHPELSGRDNIQLNGAILGMRRAEIARKFDEIVAFAEIEKFIDTPVKHYSSGMYMRLAFAVAAHLEPEILVVDEVLAVGDAEFQKKCLGKMGEIGQAGRTVLLVSHDLSAIGNLCRTAMCLSAGGPLQFGPASEVLAAYAAGVLPANQSGDLRGFPRAKGNGRYRICEGRVISASGNGAVRPDQPFRLQLGLEFPEPLKTSGIVLAAGLNSAAGQRLVELQTQFDPQPLPEREQLAGRVTVSCQVEPLRLRPGTYLLTLWAGYGNEPCDVMVNALRLEVLADDYFGTGKMPSASQGLLMLRQHWQVEAESGDANPAVQAR